MSDAANVSDLKAKVTAYKGKLVFELLAAGSIVDQVASSIDMPGNMGQVIMNSATNMGISDDALALLKTIPAGSDAIGDVDWFHSVQGWVFSWFGAPYAIKDPSDSVGARGFAIRPGQFVSILNETAQGAMDAIDAPQ